MKNIRSYARYEPRKAAFFIIAVCIILFLAVLSLRKSYYFPPNIAVNNVDVRDAEAGPIVQLQTPVNEDDKYEKRGDPTGDRVDDDVEGGGHKNWPMWEATMEPLCFESSPRSNTCVTVNDVRVAGSSHTIFFHPSSTTHQQEWKIKPYSRKFDEAALAHVAEWILTPSSAGQSVAPACTATHSVPAVVFSIGGFSGNLFHDFTDVLVPLFATAHHFRGEVQFIVSDSKSWWLNKYTSVLNQLTHYDIVEAESQGGDAVHCYPRVIVGPTFHAELGIDAAKTPTNCSVLCFKEMLRRAFGLKRSTVPPIRQKRRLLIISRRKSRSFVNEQAMVLMAESLGFEVVVGDADVSTDVAKFARLVNSADVLLGAHGAGLTNMVFLPEGAVVIQVVPWGVLDWLVGTTFRDPTAAMQLKYLEYEIEEGESTLWDKYPKYHPVLSDPASIHSQGWHALKSVYLDDQNFKPYLVKLSKTLTEALHLLSPPSDA